MQPFHNDIDFDQFFSGYFSIPFNYAARNYLNAGDFDEVANLLDFEEFVVAEDREEAFKSIRVFLDENIRLLRNSRADNYKILKPKIKHWTEPFWSGFINGLPHEFYGARHDIAFHLINLTVAIQKVNKKDCKNISHELTCLTELSPELTELIYNNHKVYTHAASSAASGSGNYSWLIWVAIVLIKIMAGC
jgi:hypothetical protein